MFFCAALATALVRSGRVQAINMERETYLRCGQAARRAQPRYPAPGVAHGPHPSRLPLSPRRAIVPIGACYAGALWVGNAAYLYLSVSFIQMLKVQGEAVCAGAAHETPGPPALRRSRAERLCAGCARRPSCPWRCSVWAACLAPKSAGPSRAAAALRAEAPGIPGAAAPS